MHINFYLAEKKNSETTRQNRLKGEKRRLLNSINDELPLALARNLHATHTAEQIRKEIAEKEARLADVRHEQEHPWVQPSAGLIQEVIGVEQELRRLQFARNEAENALNVAIRDEKPKAEAVAKLDLDALMLKIPQTMYRLRDLCILGNIADWSSCPISRALTGWDEEYGTEWRKGLVAEKPKRTIGVVLREAVGK